MHELAADIILIIHFAFILFVIFGALLFFVAKKIVLFISPLLSGDPISS